MRGAQTPIISTFTLTFIVYPFPYNTINTMSSSNFSYTADQTIPIPDASEMRFGIIVTEWNNHITDKLLEGAIKELGKMVLQKTILPLNAYRVALN